LERLETVTTRLDAVTKEREKDVSVLRADLESETESRRGWQDKAQVSQKRLLSMVWNNQYAKLQNAAKAFMIGTSSVCTRVDRCRRRHVPGNSPIFQFVQVHKPTVDSFTRSFWLVACQEVKPRPTSL